MNKAQIKALNRRLRDLYRERKSWLTGEAIATALWYGTPWCDAAAKRQRCALDCEGCMTVATCRDRAAQYDTPIREIKAQLNQAKPTPARPVQEALFA